jgi:hypothetical protein
MAGKPIQAVLGRHDVQLVDVGWAMLDIKEPPVPALLPADARVDQCDADLGIGRVAVGGLEPFRRVGGQRCGGLGEVVSLHDVPQRDDVVEGRVEAEGLEPVNVFGEVLGRLLRERPVRLHPPRAHREGSWNLRPGDVFVAFDREGATRRAGADRAGVIIRLRCLHHDAVPSVQDQRLSIRIGVPEVEGDGVLGRGVVLAGPQLLEDLQDPLAVLRVFPRQ